MIDLKSVPDDQLKQTLRLMKSEAINRGWNINIPYIGSSLCFIDRGYGNEIRTFSSTPPSTTFAAGYLANDKFATYQLLNTANLPQLESILIGDTTPFEEAEAFMNAMGTVVAKPVDGGHGKGITVGISDSDKLARALEEAKQWQMSIRATLLQLQYPYPQIYDMRISVINYKFVAATWRVAARVHGDGVRTIRELIEAENASMRRGKPYIAEFAEIDIAKSEEYLGKKIDTVPLDGLEVSVLGIANYGAGGETIDITDDIPDWLKALAEKSATISQLPVVGVDFMVAKVPTADSTPEDLYAMITEINKCPLLAMHDMPTSGKPRGAVNAYMNYLAELE